MLQNLVRNYTTNTEVTSPKILDRENQQTARFMLGITYQDLQKYNISMAAQNISSGTPLHIYPTVPLKYFFDQIEIVNTLEKLQFCFKILNKMKYFKWHTSLNK